MKIGTRLIPMAGAIALGLTVGAGAAMAHEGGHGHQMWLLARAAGITHEQIATAFKSDANLATDRANLHSARDAMMTCVVSGGGSCSNEISAYSSALQTLAQEKLTVWQSLFKQAPNTSQATTVLGELRQLHATREQIFQQVFNQQNGSQSSTSGGSPTASSSPSGE